MVEIKYKNRGVLLGKRPTDFIAGAQGALPYVVNVEDGNWVPFKPTPENQYGAGGDRFNCVTQSAQNSIKMLLIEQIMHKKMALSDIQWLTDKGYIDQFGKVQFSVRFNSITNGTIPGVGNYLYIVGDDLKNTGLIPESMLPDDNSISSEEYYNKNNITSAMTALGKEFLTRFKINYEWLNANNPFIEEMQKALKQSPVQIVINSGTHAVAEILQLSDIWKYLDSYPPYEVGKKNTEQPWSPLKYIVTYLTNNLNLNTMLKTVQPKNDNRVYAVMGGNYYWITSNRMYQEGLIGTDKIFLPFVIVDAIDPTKIIGTFNKEQ